MGELGPHIIRPTEAALEWARRAGMVMALDDPKPLFEARADAFKMFRKFYPEQDIDRNGGEVAAESLAAAKGAPVDGLLLYVEVAQRLGEGLARYVQFHREAKAWLRANAPSVLLVGFNFSTGSPQEADVGYLVGERWGEVDLLGMHCYRADAGWTIWHGRRYELVHQWTDGRHPPIVVTEYGRDAVAGEGGEGKAGWRLQNVSGEQYAKELVEGSTGFPQYVRGAVAFTAGAPEQWANFDTDGISHLLPAWQGQGGGNVADDPRIAQLLEQNRLITEALKALRQGKFTGADGVDGYIVALQGGTPLGFVPSWPKDQVPPA